MSKVLDYASVATEADARKAIQSKILDIWIHVWAIVDKKSKTACVADNSNSTEVIYLPPLSLVSCKRTTFNCHTLLL